jgi:multiple sugar transport system substrate-binding protein
MFIRGWTTYGKDFQGETMDLSKQVHVKSVPIPYMDGGCPASMFGGWDLMMSKSSSRKRETMDFANYLLSQEAQVLLYEQAGFYPVVSSFYDDPHLREVHPEIAAIRVLMKTGVHRPADKNYTNYSKMMAQYFNRAIKGEMSVNDAVEGATDAIQSQHAMIESR